MKLNLKEKKTILNFINFVKFKSKKNYILISGELNYTNKIQNNGEIFIPNNKIKLKDNFLEKEEESFINEKPVYSEGEENIYISDNDVINEDLIITNSDDSWDEKNNDYLEKVCYEQIF